MIRILEEDVYDKNVVPMNQMEPLSVGVLIASGEYVMRTASSSHFEVINLTEPGHNKCWTDNPTRDVRLLADGEVLVIGLTNDEMLRNVKCKKRSR